MYKNKIIKVSLLLLMLASTQISKPNNALRLCIAPFAGLAIYKGCNLLDQADKESAFLKSCAYNISGLSLLSLGAMTSSFITIFGVPFR